MFEKSQSPVSLILPNSFNEFLDDVKEKDAQSTIYYKLFPKS